MRKSQYENMARPKVHLYAVVDEYRRSPNFCRGGIGLQYVQWNHHIVSIA